jgi:hypothetical protein
VTEELTFPSTLQAAALVRRWLTREPRTSPPGAAIPVTAPLPAVAADRLQSLAWVVHEQRLGAVLIAALAAACGIVWLAAIPLGAKPALVVRAGPSLKEAAAGFYRVPELSYDQLAFFLHGCVPLLYASQAGQSPLLPLAEGLAAPEICREAERRLAAHSAAMAAQGMTQALTLTAIANVVSDSGAGRAAADLSGYLTVTTRPGGARFFPWRGRAVVAANPGSRLDPYPFYLLTLEAQSSPP